MLGKKSPKMKDYENIYSIPELKEDWDIFFQNKVLYRELMLSGAKGKQRQIYAKFLISF